MDPANASESRAEAFVAVDGAVEEDISGGALMLTAYAALWLVLMLYMVRLQRLHARLAGDARELRRMIDG